MKAKEFLHNTQVGKGTLHSGIMYGSFTAMGAVATFGVANSFFKKLESLKMMYADMTGKDIRDVSTISVISGDLPNMPRAVAEARDHLLKEHSGRFLAQLVGFGLNLRGLVKGEWAQVNLVPLWIWPVGLCRRLPMLVLTPSWANRRCWKSIKAL